MNWKTAMQIYMSKYKFNGKYLTRKDFFLGAFLFWILIPIFFLIIPFQIYSIKKGSLPKDKRKNYLFYKGGNIK